MKKVLSVLLIFLSFILAGAIVAVVYFSVSDSETASSSASTSSVASSSSQSSASSSAESSSSESQKRESSGSDDSVESEIQQALASEAETKVLLGRELYDSWIYLDITEETTFLMAIHYMTHQKVLADSKQGALEITPERIAIMLEQAEAFSDSAHYPFYIEILNAWDAGDFSNAVYAHNYVWTAQDGTIGEAYGLFDESQEAEFVQANFRDVGY
ncbi:DUF6241 domain-containing protein [Aerococcus urinaeequi]|uniref:DUF6241 domain-containing protein n=1 Tax=Aerococcus urinaeequi TaxID=51665 RepID=UPI003AAD5EC1